MRINENIGPWASATFTVDLRKKERRTPGGNPGRAVNKNRRRSAARFLGVIGTKTALVFWKAGIAVPAPSPSRFLLAR